MADIDSAASYKRFDPSVMEVRLASLPQQCRRGFQAGLAARLPASYKSIDKIAVMGMGGSAISGDYLADLLSLEKAPPIVVQREYTPPSFTDSRTLAIASSYSGATEETLTAFERAGEQGAKLLAITSGGSLASMAKEAGAPCINIGLKGEPRTTVGFTFFALLGTLQSLGVISPKDDAVESTVDSLEEQLAGLKPGVPSADNPAKQIARFLHGKVAVIYGAEITGGVARAWKTGLDENSKIWAFAERIPEANHNSVVGYALPASAKGTLAAIFLRSSLLNPRIQLRYGITQDLLAQAGVPWREAQAPGEGALTHMIGLHLLGLYVSYYLAVLNGVDPSPTKVIDTLKSRLATEA